uniref:Uncharacterized protein n=1 Tax=Cyclopterus lumpus TaxID=8103 RepID=A0A8C2WJZ2_CYCLU
NIILFIKEPCVPLEPLVPLVKEPLVPLVKEPCGPLLKEPCGPLVKEPCVFHVKEPCVPLVKEPLVPLVKEPRVPLVKEPPPAPSARRPGGCRVRCRHSGSRAPLYSLDNINVSPIKKR